MKSEHASSTPIRVAIVGGGCAGLTAAFELSRPEHNGRYQVTVYQMGWRLGGKGASGRGVGARIEEHGLHVWMGFYENAFRLMRACYGELGRDPYRCPVASWQDAFKPAPWVGVTDRDQRGAWEAWVARFPPQPGLPGDPLEANNPFTMRSYLAKSIALVSELLRAAEAHGERHEPAASDESGRTERLVEGIEWILRHGQLATAAALIEATDILRRALELLPAKLGDLLVRLTDAIAAAARRQLAMLVEGDDSLRNTYQVVDLVLAVVRGSIAHGLALTPQGFDAIDEYDWRSWLRMHGASEQALASGFMRGIYDLAFAYEHGDPERPSLSAAAALRGAMRMFFTYRGSLFWRMSAGMGDIVFAPLYEVLAQRGVRFEFFHRLEEAQLCAANEPDQHVSALRFSLQAAVREGAYRPLIDVHGLPCWPAQPDYAQLVEGERMQREGYVFESPWESRVAGERTLKVGEDFDLAVLALGGAAMPHVSAALIERAPKWQAMVASLHGVPTQALQLWLQEDTATLGFRTPQVTLSGWVEPFDTWADMTHLIPAEDARADVRSVAYFCSPLPDLGGVAARDEKDHATQYARVRENARRFVEHELPALWPNARDARGFRWDLLAVEPEQEPAGEGHARLDTQFWTANVRPSDRYMLTLPGTQKYRLSPLDRSFDNLTVAGDWTESGLNTGCVESAVISGLLAAHAISGKPALHEIIGYDHP